MLSLLSKEAYQFVAQKKEKTKKKRKERKLVFLIIGDSTGGVGR
jgi:hypothetical protein